MTRDTELHFCDTDTASRLEACRSLVDDGVRSVTVSPPGPAAEEFVHAVRAANLPLDVTVAGEPESLPDAPTDAVLLASDDADWVSGTLLQFVRSKSCRIVAPVTPNHFTQRPLFLVSIPKAGTHLLYRLVELMGYGRGIEFSGDPAPGNWYCVEYSNSHTVARDFFIDSVRRSPFGHRLHAFPRSPTLFVYRNPLDVVVSEANYYHKDGRTLFGGYLSQLDFRDRLLRLIDDPWLLGTIRDRVGGFLPWLDFPNVVPIAFEELVGARGGASAELQSRLVWSLQLKLHVPGRTSDVAAKVFDEKSPTFHAGKINAYRDQFFDEAYAAFEALPTDFMDGYGYEAHNVRNGRPDLDASPIPSRVEEFAARPLVYSSTSFDEMPVAVRYDHLGFNIVRHGGQYLGIPQGVDFDPVTAKKVPPAVMVANSLSQLETMIVARHCANRRAILLGRDVA